MGRVKTATTSVSFKPLRRTTFGLTISLYGNQLIGAGFYERSTLNAVDYKMNHKVKGSSPCTFQRRIEIINLELIRDLFAKLTTFPDQPWDSGWIFN